MRRLAAPLLALALVAGCGGGAEIAGVGETSFRLSDVGALYEGGTLPAVDFRQALFRLMAVEILSQALEADFQVTVEAADVDEQLAQLEEMLAQTGATPAEYLGEPNASDEMLRFNAEVLALREAALERLVVDPEVVDRLFTDPATLTTVCSKHILVAAEEDAEAVIERLGQGEDFAAVAAEVSLDTGSEGGDLGCVSAAAFVPQFSAAVMEAAIGEVVGPVATEFGFHVLVVSERTAPTRDEYLADPRSLLSDEELSNLWSEWFNEQLQAADAWVAERYGTWTPMGVLAPAAGTTTTAPPG